MPPKKPLPKMPTGKNAVIAKIKAQQEAIKKRDEELLKLEQAERAREAEEERLAKEAAKLEKQEAEKAAELAKAEKQQQAKEQKQSRHERLRQQKLRSLMGSGIIMPEGAQHVDALPVMVSQVKKEHDSPTKVMEVIEESKSHRAPICCVLGHVDTGKTSLLDKLRHTKVQKGETAGITQQIGATMFTPQMIHDYIGDFSLPNVMVEATTEFDNTGILVIDTPGHEAFGNLRKQGSSMCDIAILVIDIMHGIEKQTIESIQLLKQQKCPFVVALNKIDRLYQWKLHDGADFQTSFEKQKRGTQEEFENRLQQVVVALAEQGFNAALHNKNNDFKRDVSIIPTCASGDSGCGIIDIIYMINYLSKMFMSKKLTTKDEFECTVFETKHCKEHGATIDVVIVNGQLKTGSTIGMASINGNMMTTKIKAILVPNPMIEQRVAKEYAQTRVAHATQIVKICGDGLEKVMPGSRVYIIESKDNFSEIEAKLTKDIETSLSTLKLADSGVCIQAPTLGSLEAMISELNGKNIPVCSAHIGNITKNHASNVLTRRMKEPKYGVILAFDVDVTDSARDFVRDNHVEVLKEKTIYRLIGNYMAWLKRYEDEVKRKVANSLVYPVEMEVIDSFVKGGDYMVLGCRVKEGVLRNGTPLYFMKEGSVVEMGRVCGMQKHNVDVGEAIVGDEVGVKINNVKKLQCGRHFDEGIYVKSHISRESIDALKIIDRKFLENPAFRTLIVGLKQELGI